MVDTLDLFRGQEYYYYRQIISNSIYDHIYNSILFILKCTLAHLCYFAAAQWPLEETADHARISRVSVGVSLTVSVCFQHQ